MTLLAVLILVIVTSILAGSAALAWVRYYDLTARQNEKAALADIERAIRAGIVAHAAIPGPSDLLAAVAGVTEWSLAAMRTNERGNPRVVLADPQFEFERYGSLDIGGLPTPETVNLPYVQTVRGALEVESPRLLLLSSA
ncbi:MAG: type II secretion system protein, partial [Verrucomicrobiae bacterium]|nr:type II secretion system protein [Verrucomicrobiae bacterium]